MPTSNARLRGLAPWACLLIAGCTGQLMVDGLGSNATRLESRIGGALRVGDEVGTSLTFHDEDLTETINEFNGSLDLRLPVYRIGDYVGEVGYLGGEKPVGAWVRWNNGLGHWNRPWVARLTRDQTGVALFTLPDGRMSQLSVPDADDLEHGITSDGGTWRALPGGRHFEVTTQGVTYTMNVGDCIDMWWDAGEWSAPYYSEGPNGTITGHCEASRAVDAHGNGLRVEYYGLTDTRLHNDTFIPRLMARVRRGPDGASIDEGYAYFDLRDQSNVTGAQPDRTDLIFPGRHCNLQGCAPQSWPGGVTTNDTLIRRIRYPGAQSNPLAEDGSWQETSFEWTAASGGAAPTALSVTTPRGTYAFEYHPREIPADSYDTVEWPNHITAVRTPAGRRVSWTWESLTLSHSLTATPLVDGQSTTQTMVVNRTLELEQYAPGAEHTFEWDIHHFGVDGPNNADRHAAYTTYPTGMSTLTLFFPPAVDGGAHGYPGFLNEDGYPLILLNAAMMWTRAGLMTERYVFDHYVWNDGANQLAASVAELSEQAVQTEQRGYASHVLGELRLGSWTNQTPLLLPFAHGWMHVPAFEVFSQRDTSSATNSSQPNCCAEITYSSRTADDDYENTVRCRVTGARPASLCSAGHSVVASGSCGSAPVCYDATSSSSSAHQTCATNFGEPLSCPTGTQQVAASATCSASCEWSDDATAHLVNHSVVVLYRENHAGTRRRSHAESGNTDYDLYGNPAFMRQFTTTQPVVITRSPVNCRMLSQPECGQDSIQATPTNADETRETRIRYVVDTAAAADYIAAGLTNLVVERRQCVPGSVCEPGNGLLSLTHRGYDNRAPGSPLASSSAAYPLADSPGRTTSEARGDLTFEEDVDLENDAGTRRTHTRFYSAADAGQRPGAVAERAVLYAAGQYRVSRQSYDGTNNVHGVIRGPTSHWVVTPSGTTLTSEVRYDGWGAVTEEVSRPYGSPRRTCRDAIGRITALFEPGDSFSSCDDTSGASVVNSYPDFHTVTTETRPRRGGTTFTSTSTVRLDSLDRAITSEVSRLRSDGTPVRVAKSISYLADTSLRTLETEPYASTTGAVFGLNHARTRTFYDVFGRSTRVVRENSAFANIGETRTRYGNTDPELSFAQVETIDQDGNVTMMTSDGIGRVSASRLADGATTRTAYDGLSRPTTITQADGLQSTTRYIGLHEIRRTAPETGELRILFGPGGDVVETQQANGNRVRFERDSLGRPTRRVSGNGAGHTEIAYTYDAYPADSTVSPALRLGVHRLTSVAFDEGRVDFGYDAQGRLAEQVTRLNGLPEKRLSLEHDQAGSVSRQSYQAGAEDSMVLESVIEASLSMNYEVQGVRVDGAFVTRIAYDDLGRPSQRHLLSGATTLQTEDMVYDDFARLVGVNDPAALGSDAFAYRLHYATPTPGLGAVPRRSAPSEVEWAHQGLGRSAYLMTYDARNRITAADYRANTSGSWSNPASYDFAATYRPDGLGSISTITRSNQAGQSSTSTLSYDPATRRLLSSVGAVQARFTYDAAGNLTANSEWGPSTRLGYAHNARPRYAQDGEDRLEYGYDYQDNYVRIARQRWNPVCPTAPVEPEETGGRGPRDAGCYQTVDTRRFVRDPSGNVIAEYTDAVLTRHEVPGVGFRTRNASTGATAMHFALQDHIGSTRAVLNDQGTVIDRNDYDPFGASLTGQSLSASVAPEDSFATYRRLNIFSSAIDLSPARFYHPGVGQFLAPDPLANENTHTGAYVYAEDSPFALNDPSGMDPPRWIESAWTRMLDFMGITWRSGGTLQEVVITAQRTPVAEAPRDPFGVRVVGEFQATVGPVVFTAELGWEFSGSERNGGVAQHKLEVLNNPFQMGLEAQGAIRVTVGNLDALVGKDALELSVIRVPLPPIGVAQGEAQLSLHKSGDAIAFSVRVEYAIGYAGKVHGYKADGGTVVGRITSAMNGATGISETDRRAMQSIMPTLCEMVASSLNAAMPPGTTLINGELQR